ncbi:MAG TPA: ATP-binding cassette domain-containing protein [Bacilli bacterium]|nr:ATP-binding cassette domain-containing protein [Bacilli bacterium]
MFTRPASNLAQIFNVIQAAIAGGYRVFSIIDEPHEYQNEEDKEILTSTKGKVEFENVNFSYIPGTPVLKDISFTAKPGQTIAIVGPTGSGKTTIINLLTRFYDIDSGDILIDGRSIYDYTKDSLRSMIGIVLQTTYLFKGTVLENIRYGNPNATFEDVVRAAKLAQVHDIIERLPQKYNTMVKEGGINFSHGERQLISIARTILSNPQILILDEATSSVDTRTEFNIQRSIQEVIKGRTSFVIAHRLQTIRKADIILVIHQGKLIEQGSHEELMAKRGMYYEMYTTQFQDAKV